MDVFKSIKSKWVSVKQDLTNSIKTSVISPKEENQGKSLVGNADNEYVPVGKTELIGVENSAAQDTLHQYENAWEAIQRLTSENLRKAKVIDKQSNTIQSGISVFSQQALKFDAEVNHLSVVFSELQSITDQVVEIHSQCALIEDGLSTLENLTALLRHEKLKTAELHKYFGYEEQKRHELNKLSEELAAEYKEKLHIEEMKEMQLRRQKELFYQKSFEEDMERYKAQNTIAQKDLGNVTIEPSLEDTVNLEKFLEDAEPVLSTASSVNPPSPNTQSASRDRSTSNLSVASLEWDGNGDEIHVLHTDEILDETFQLSSENPKHEKSNAHPNHHPNHVNSNDNEPRHDLKQEA